MTIKVGEEIPSITLRIMGADGPKDITTDEIFRGGKVAVFGLPGAFTPVCSAKHLPGFVNNAEALRKRGIDRVACVSVNDAYVMDAWGKALNVGDKVMMVADGNAAFTKAVGLEEDKTVAHMGLRSQRYAMIVEGGVVKLLNIEKPKEFCVSSAEALLEATG